MRKVLIGLGVVGLFLVSVEATLRWLVPASLLYRGLRHVPTMHERYWRYRFAELADQRLDEKLYDPDLGWDYETDGDRIRGSRVYALDKRRGTVRVVTLGDSFTYGNELLDDAAPYPAVLETLLPYSEVLNLATGGYGIDQAILKYEKVGRRYAPDLVILGVFSGMYERTSLGFFSGAKPVFRRDAWGEFRLLNHPVPRPGTALAAIRADMAAEVRIWAAARTLAMQVGADARREASYVETDRTIAHVLRRLDAPRRLVVHIPAGDVFRSPRDRHAFVASPEYRHLLGALERTGWPVIDLTEAFPRTHGYEVVYRQFYIHRADGSVGHLTPGGHREVARLLAAAIASPAPRTSRSRRSQSAPSVLDKTRAAGEARSRRGRLSSRRPTA